MEQVEPKREQENGGGMSNDGGGEEEVPENKRRRDELEEEANQLRAENRQLKTAIDSATDDFVCPITKELPYDPVTAEDGRVYERSAIEELIARRRGRDLRSPWTNEAMGKKLLPAVHVRNSIESLIASGADLGGKADLWKEKEIILVYPFAAEESVFDNACDGLREVGGEVVIGRARDEERITTWGRPEEVDSGGRHPGSAGRMNVNIRSEDLDSLEPGRFLNDAIIDFFMSWISRKEDPNDSKVHFFELQFFTTLKDEGDFGVDAVASWTENIDIFSKSFIFIPISEGLHRSLCVVVNPGHIMNEIMEEEDQSEEDDCPCILFLDSLKAHRKARVAIKVRQWLNAEAKRLKKFEGMFENRRVAFCKNSMPVIDPKVPYQDQDNSWDSGVFVCRYAYSLFLLRNRRFTYRDYDEKFRHAITRSPEFDFCVDDIRRMRREMKTLIEKLSGSYLERDNRGS